MLVPTKLFIPQIHSILVMRQRLTDKISAGKDRKLILVCAPAGFGKTSLLCQWIQQDQPQVAWYALDEDDSKPESFFRYFLAALQTLDDQLKTALMPLLQSQTILPPEQLLTLLINRLVNLPTDSYLVLDDYHLIQPDTSPVHEAIQLLLQHAPPQFHLVMSTRNELPFPVARFRVNNEITEIQGADLQFSETETRQFFETMYNMQLSQAQVQRLHERSEGWAACLQLAGLSLRDQTDLDRLMTHFGIQRPVADYLLEEVFQEQSQHVQEFLLKTSVLKRLHVDLCNELTERDDAAEILEHLERSNLFVFALDAERQWFRYHHLLAEFLQHRLKRTANDLWEELHRKAALWFADQELFDDARVHAIASGDLEFAADLLEQHGGTILRKCHFAAFRNWFTLLPDELVNQRLLLKLSRVSIYVQQNDFTDIERLLTELEQALSRYTGQRYSESLVHRIQDLITAFRVYCLQFFQEYDQALSKGKRALQTVDPEHPESWGLIQTTLAIAYIEQGDVLQAIAPIKAGFEAMCAAKLGFTAVALFWFQARVEKLQGHLQQAERILWNGLSWAKEAEFVPLLVTVALHSAFADIFYEQNHLTWAREHAEQALEYAEASMHRGFLSLAYGIKAYICQALGQPDEAWQLGQEALNNIRKIESLGYIRLAEAQIVRLALHQGKLDFPIQWMKRRQLRSDEPFSQTFEKESLALAGIYLAQQRYQEAVDCLTNLRTQSLSRNRKESVLKIDILQAAARDGLGDRQAALELLEKAILIAKPEGYVRVFADQAFLIADLLLALQRSQNKCVRAYVPILLDACGIKPTISSSPLAVDGLEYLTSREVEILRLIAAGYTNQQIAEQTFVSLNTVKSHIKHIYSKLAVSNRAQAILKAKEFWIDD